MKTFETRSRLSKAFVLSDGPLSFLILLLGLRWTPSPLLGITYRVPWRKAEPQPDQETVISP